MDTSLIAGIIIGFVVGFSCCAFRAAFRGWRGAIAAVPVARRNAFLFGKEALIIAGVCILAVAAATQSGG